jgi:transcriptional regulator
MQFAFASQLAIVGETISLQKGRLDLLHVQGVEAIGMKTEGKFDLPQGTLDLLIMRVVALGPIHGYAIAQRIQQMSREALRVQQGSLYPALHRLEYKKLLASNWQSSETGREAKFYELTVKGQAHLQAETENWERLTDVVGLILKGTLEGLS